jgi:hypothetical protein
MLRENLVAASLAWEAAFGNAPHITAVVSELDAALLMGMSTTEYALAMQGSTAVRRGYDFVLNNLRYQVKANRPSGKPGSFVTLVPKVSNYEWDALIWILYDREYVMQEAWLWEMDAYKDAFDAVKRLGPAHYRRGKALHDKRGAAAG